MTGELLIYDIIGADFWTGEGVTAKSVKSQLSAMEADPSIDAINVRINSPGGDVFEGVAIYNMLLQAKKPVNTFVDGIAYSMAGIIALAGQKVAAAKNATILIHNVYGGAMGNSKDLAGAVEMMQKLDNSLAISIAEKTGMTVEDVMAKWLDFQDHTLSADEALGAKLIDEVINRPAENVPANLAAMSITDVYAFYAKQRGTDNKENFVSGIVNRLREAVNFKPKKEEVMNFSNLKNAITEGKIVLADADKVAVMAEIEAMTAEKNILTHDELASFVSAQAELVQAKADLAAEKAAHEELKAKAVSPAATVQEVADIIEEAKPAYNETGWDKKAKELKAKGQI